MVVGLGLASCCRASLHMDSLLFFNVVAIVAISIGKPASRFAISNAIGYTSGSSTVSSTLFLNQIHASFFFLLDYYIVRFILYFPRIVIFIFLGLYSLAYVRPPLVLVIYSL